MGNLKNKWVKPGGSFNYTEAVKVYNPSTTVTIDTNDILYISGVTGGMGTVALADASSSRTADGRLLIAKHSIPPESYGVALPWKIVEGVDVATVDSGAQGGFGDLWIVGAAGLDFGGDAGKLYDASVTATEAAAIIADDTAIVRPMAKTIKETSAPGVADGALLVSLTTPL